MTQIKYTGCCIHVTGVELKSDNSLVFTLSNGNTIETDTISVTGQANINVVSGVVSGNNIILTNSDNSTIVINAAALVNSYTAGTGIDIASNVISIEALTEVGSGISLINNKPNHVFKTLASSNSSLIINDNGSLLDIQVNVPLQYTITTSNTVTLLSNRTSYYRNNFSLSNNEIILPPVISVPFGVEYHVFAASDLVIKTTANVAEIVPSIASPHNFVSTALVDTITVSNNEYYIIRKYSTSAFIISKQ